MKKSLSVGIFCLSMLAISGCSSSKGDDSAKASAVLSGDYLLYTAGNKTPIQEMLSGGTDLNMLTLNGDEFSIPVNGDYEMLDQNNVKIGDKTYSRFVVSGSKYRFIKFGALDTPERAVIFSQGFPTGELPKEGITTYQGDSALYLPETKTTPKFSGVGTFAAIVNFGKKELTAEMDTLNADPHPIQFRARINGNKFVSATEGALVKGGFYGDNAAEMSGYYQSGENLGAFGGKKVINP